MKQAFALKKVVVIVVNKLPDEKPIIGFRQVKKAAKKGELKQIVLASNAPDWIKKDVAKLGVSFDEFNGDEEQLATMVGKSFPIAVIGYKTSEK